MKAILAFVVLGLVSIFSGCGAREHMREDFGQQTNKFLAAQRISNKAAEGNPLGLDSEEAAIIHGAYRKSIGGPGDSGSDESSKVLLLEGTDYGKQKK